MFCFLAPGKKNAAVSRSRPSPTLAHTHWALGLDTQEFGALGQRSEFFSLQKELNCLRLGGGLGSGRQASVDQADGGPVFILGGPR